MIIDNLSITGLRIFTEVFLNKSMSQAAKKLHMTQPGVSQQIGQLESILGHKLFDRVGRNIVVTSQGHELYKIVFPVLMSLETGLSDFQTNPLNLKGEIRLGLPIEFGNNVILPLISKWSKLHPEVSFNINYDFATRQISSLQNGSLEFIIADNVTLPSNIEVTPLLKEHLVLCANRDYAKENGINENSTFDSLKKLNFIDYLEDGTVAKQWLKHHFNKVTDIKLIASLMDVQGIARMINGGMGLGVLPMHFIKRSKNKDNYLIINGSKNQLYNEISLALLKGKTLGRPSEAFIKYLLEQRGRK